MFYVSIIIISLYSALTKGEKPKLLMSLCAKCYGSNGTMLRMTNPTDPPSASVMCVLLLASFLSVNHSDELEFIQVPGLWSMLASSSRCCLRLARLAGSPVLCRTIVSSWTLFANDSGDCSLITRRMTRVGYTKFLGCGTFFAFLLWATAYLCSYFCFFMLHDQSLQ